MWLAWAAIAQAVVLVVYSNSLQNGFHFDDFHTIVDNPAVRSLNHLGSFFTDATLFSVLPANRTYRPIVSSSLAVDYALGHGYHPFWFHLSTLFWFTALLWLTGFMYFRAMEAVQPHKTAANALWSVAGAAWFGVHPAMAETVNYIIQRGDVYCTLGCVAALVMWAWWPRARPWGMYLLPVIAGVLSKPPAAVFPALLLFWVFFCETGGTLWARWRKALLAIIPSLLIVIALMALESHMTPKTFAPSVISGADYRMTQPLVWMRYCGELFLPLHLNVDTDLPAYGRVNEAVVAGFIFAAAMLAAIVYTARRREWYPVAFGLVWFVVTQLPTSLYALSEVENDHRMFFSFTGLILAVIGALRIFAASWLDRPHPRWIEKALVLCGLFALSAYAWGAHARNRVWRTEESLWKDDTLKSPRNGRGLMNYGLQLMERGDYAQAQDEFEKALEYTPNYPTLEINLGVVDGAMGNAKGAERHFSRAILLAPADDQPHAYYGRWLLGVGRTQDAIAQLQEAVQLNPVRDFQRGMLAQAEARQQKALTQSQGRISAGEWINRSLVLNRIGQFDQSIAAARRALELDPDSAEAWNNIAAGYESEQKWDEAIAAATRALALKPDFQLAKNNLAWSEQQKTIQNARR